MRQILIPSYYSCRRGPVVAGAQVDGPDVTVADREKPRDVCLEWHGR